MEEVLAFLLASPALQTFVETIAVKVIIEILHRRKIDPEFEKNSDAAFALYANAQTDEDEKNALSALQKLMATPSPR